MYFDSIYAAVVFQQKKSNKIQLNQRFLVTKCNE